MNTNNERYDMERIAAMKAGLQNELNESRQRIAQHWDNLTTEPAQQTRQQMFMNQVSKGLALYDGVMTGYKLYKRLRLMGSLVSWFTGKKKKKKQA